MTKKNEQKKTKTKILKTPKKTPRGDKRLENLLAPWKPGESGNPKGNHLGTKHASTKFQEMLNRIDPKKKKRYGELFEKKILELTVGRGNVRMMEIVLNYLYGKPIANIKDQTPSKWSGRSKEEIIEFILGRVRGDSGSPRRPGRER